MILASEIPHITVKELAAKPTQCLGQAANLKHEQYVDAHDGMYLVRYWLNRVGKADGAKFAVEVEVRACPDGTWRDMGGYGAPLA